MAETRSPRRVVMETIKQAAKTVRNGSYYAKRGPINWAVFPFTKSPRAIAIGVDESPFLPPSGMVDALVSLEIAAAMPGDGEDPSFNEGILDQFYEDADEIARQLLAAKDGNGDAVVTKIVGGIAKEMKDEDLGVQGLIVTMTVGW